MVSINKPANQIRIPKYEINTISVDSVLKYAIDDRRTTKTVKP